MSNVKEKIKKLLALAESPNEEEAKAALLKARKLMAEHKLRMSDLQQDNTEVVNQETDITCTTLTNSWAVQLSTIIADRYCCKAFYSRHKKKKTVTIGFIGLRDDFEVCSKIFRYAFEFVEKQCKAIKAEYKDYYSTAVVRKLMNAYGDGFCEGLQEAFEEQQKQHQEWGLVLMTPKVVLDIADTMQEGVFREDDDYDETYDTFMQGYQDGKKFDSSTKLEQAPIQ